MIRVTDLVKNYGRVRALKSISFEVDKGSVFGFIGRNGAGKTTTMNILTGLIRFNSGKIFIKGKDFIMVGDMPTDIEAGKESGIWTIGIASGISNKDALWEYNPDILVNSLKELINMIGIGKSNSNSHVHESIKIKSYEKVFEIGTGCGLIALECARLGANVVCSDINPYAIELEKLL